MKRNKALRTAKGIAAIIVLIASCTLLASFLWPIPIPLGSCGRPEATDFRPMEKEFDKHPYVEAADEFIMEWQRSHGLKREHWEKPKIVVETESSVKVYFAKKEPLLLHNGMLVVGKELPDMTGVKVRKRDMTCEFLPLR